MMIMGSQLEITLRQQLDERLRVLREGTSLSEAQAIAWDISGCEEECRVLQTLCLTDESLTIQQLCDLCQESALEVAQALADLGFRGLEIEESDHTFRATDLGRKVANAILSGV